MNTFSDKSFQDDLFTQKESVNVREVIRKYVYHWPVFIVGMLLTVSLAYLYLHYTPPVYNVKAALLIKDAKNDNGGLIKELNLFPDSRVVDNEMEILRSKSLMKEVVQKLYLNVTYYTKGRAFMTDIYLSRPFNVIFQQVNDIMKEKTYTFHVINTDYYEIEDGDMKKKYAGRFGEFQKMPFGICKIEKTPFFAGYAGQTIFLKINDVETTANAILKTLVLNQVNKGANIIELSMNEEVPQRGKDILNTLIEVYNEAAVEDKNLSTKNSIKFIRDRLVYIAKDLEDIEKGMENFQVSHGVIDISGKAQAYQENVRANDSKLNEINLKLSAVEALNSYLNSTDGRKVEDPSILVGISEPGLVTNINQLLALQIQYDRLLETTTELNPLAVNLNKQIRYMRTVIKATINGILISLRREKEQLLANNNTFETSIRDIPSVERQLVGIKRQQGIKESLYLLLLQKLETAALSSAVAMADNRILEKAYGSRFPVKPDKKFVYLLALLAGILLPVGYVFSKDAFNFRVISNNDISERTSVPIIADIMFDEGLPAIVLTNDSRTLIAEQFRALRTNIQYIYGDLKGARVTLFTSSMSGEGKSFITSNLAAALAMTDRKTVILELDLRKPKISKYLNLKNRMGLSNYLIGKATKEEIIQPSGIHPNLFVISSGPIPPNPAELLEQHAIDELIMWLRTQFSEIMIDTPPIGLVTDALILSRLTDASIYVVRHGVTLKSQVNAIEVLRREQKFPKLNIVHNGVKNSGRFGYGYESQYGYGYGYGYSYGSYYTTNKKKRKRDILPSFVINFLKRF